MKNDNHVGETYGIYTLIEFLNEKDKYGHYLYKGKCKICGYETVRPFSHFSAPSAITNNCKHLDRNGNYYNFNKYNWSNERIGSIFNGIKDRCYNKNNKSYKWYGEKGVKVCKEWIDNPKLFENWALSNGYKDNLTIDRINNDGDYCPDNCRWADTETQCNNRESNIKIKIGNTTKSLLEWCKIFDVDYSVVHARYERNGFISIDDLFNNVGQYRGNQQTADTVERSE